MHYHWMINAGHGGITPNGVYTTAPNKMYKFDDDFVSYEGVINRQIAEKLYHQLQKLKIDFSLIHDNYIDTPLSQRSELVNKVYNKNKLVYKKESILLELHSNASVNHDGKGIEVWTSPGQTKSDVIAQTLCDLYKKHFPEFPFRSDTYDGDDDKEARFWMLVKTICPAVLVENLFFDNREEAEFLMSFDGQNRIVDCLLEWVLEIEQTKPI